MPTSLSYKQRQALYDEFRRRKAENNNTQQRDMAVWAKEKFCLRFAPNQSTISRILKQQHNNPVPRSLCIKKRDRVGKNHALEQALFSWVSQQCAVGQPMSGAMICDKAVQLQGRINDRLPQESRFNMKFSNGWLFRFQKRWGLKGRTPRPGDTDSDYKSAEAIKEQLKIYQPKDIWHADEFGLLYKLAPSKKISRVQRADPEEEKTRITCMACCNADGSDKLPLMIIGEARQPQSFRGKNGQKLGFDYHSNSKAWMTGSLFLDWVVRFDRYICAKQSETVALLVDNCSAHGTSGTLPELKQVKIIYLPSDTTSCVQPLQAGVIEATKLRYRTMQMERALDLIDCNADDMYKLDQLTAMTWVTSVWNRLPQSVFKSAWRGTGFIEAEDPGSAAGETDQLDIEKNTLFTMVKELIPPGERLSLEELLNAEPDELCTAKLTEEALVDSVVHDLLEVDAPAPVEDNEIKEEEQTNLPPVAEQLESIAAVKVLCETICPSNSSLLKELKQLQKEVRQKKFDSAAAL